MTLPNTPIAWAGRLSMIHKTFCVAHAIDRFPLDTSTLVHEYSKQFFPNEPITKVQGENFGDQFEGALVPNDDKNEWLVIYNQATKNAGRINFTIAHEFGHYLLHRQDIVMRKQCTRHDMSSWYSNDSNIEIEANTFAARFLMPTEDFFKQIHSQEISLSLIQQLANRYQVSLNALVLRLINIIKQPAMVVSTVDGYINWAWSNDRLMKLGVYYPARQKTIEPPSKSLINRGINGTIECLHNEGVWMGPGQVKEILVYHKEEFSLSLLLYDPKLNKDDVCNELTENEEEFA